MQLHKRGSTTPQLAEERISKLEYRLNNIHQSKDTKENEGKK